ncbi:hypothetical protein GGF46_002623 [Coemansia sp. RSA 552]|nr:hypothetical protein GGF46_002623 [Coemansia sp. RSA 552]
MRFSGKVHSRIHTIGDNDICLGPGLASLPRNPVFYPPTSSEKNLSVSSEVVPPAAATKDGRPARLISRLRTLFTPKGDRAALHADSHSPSDKRRSALGDTAQALPRAKQRPRQRLVARSPQRESSAFPGLGDLAELGIISRAYQTRTQTHMPAGRPKAQRSPTDGQVYAKRRCRAALTASVFMPLDEQVAQSQSLLTRAVSLMPTPRQLPSPLQSEYDCAQGEYNSVPSEYNNVPSEYDCVPGEYSSVQCHRDSSSSDSTAIPDPPQAGMPNIALGPADTPRTLYSPSQRTLGATDCDYQLLVLPGQSLDVFESCSAARRPYSEGFSEHAHVPLGGICAGDDAFLLSQMDLDGYQRTMYMRASCAESELVKTTFDLAKLLPSAPQ